MTGEGVFCYARQEPKILLGGLKISESRVDMAVRLSRRVRETLLGECGITQGERLLVAVSGGADSVALLHLLLGLTEELDLRLTAAHLDHALRDESVHDASFVSELCHEWKVPLVVERVDVQSEAKRLRTGLEDAAREVRMQFLREVAQRNSCSAIALAHHRQDQAETVLHRLLRGTGNRGLAAMAWRRDCFVRPLLETEPAELRRYLEISAISWREDASNCDLSLTRNRIRHQVLPLLRQLNPRVEKALSGVATRAAVDEDFWREQIASAQNQVISRAGDAWRVDLDRLDDYHPAIRVRLLRAAVSMSRGDETGISSYHLDDLLALLEGKRSQWDLDLPGCWVGRRYRSLWLQREAPAAMSHYELEIPGPGRYELPGGGVFEIGTGEADTEDRWSAVLNPNVLHFPLTIRNLRPGDRFRPSGLAGRMKLKDFFINEKVPIEARSRLPLLVDAELIWVAGLRLAEGYAAEDRDGSVRVAFRPPEDWTFLL
ncbi:MAG: tRNA lysidine(34) synthetase TilS [Desulfuromonas sp.]|nr:MAG: tRNA lysidine(34) synthetase TilS [Desulfuromonas sp.]